MTHPTPLILATRLSQQTVAPLVDALRKQQNKPLQVDASAVKHIGAPGYEALLSAARSWKDAGVDFTIINPSKVFLEGLAYIGLAAQEFGINEG